MPTTLSEEITNLQASPRVLNPVGLAGGRERICQGTLEVADGDFDADADEIHLCTLPGNARVTSIMIGADAMDTSTTSLVNVGFSRVSAVSPSTTTIVDEDYFATVVTSFRGALRLTEFVDESGITGAAGNAEQWGERLWEIAADASDTGTYFNITMTQTATVTTDAAATIYYVVRYVID